MANLQNSSSLESSMSGSFIVSSTASVATETYQRAAKLFLTKSFVDSLNTLEPLLADAKELRRTGQLSEKTWIKSWKLYFVLLDAAARQQEEASTRSPSSSSSSSSSSISGTNSVSSSWPKKVRLELVKKITDGSLWKQVENEFGGSLSSAPPDIVFGLTSLTIRHGTTNNSILSMVSESLELYLSSMSDLVQSFDDTYRHEYLKVLDLYILKVLPLRNEYDLAREMIESSQFYDSHVKEEKRRQLIKSEENLVKKKQKKEEEDSKRKQMEALREEAKRKHERLVQQQRQQQKQLQQQQQQQQQLEQKTSLEHQQSSVNSLSSSGLGPRRTASPTPPRSSNPVRSFDSLIFYWRRRATAIVQSAMVWKIIAFFIIIVLSVSNPLARERARRIVNNVWRKLSETARMGFKVSFV
ncbi:hypothetical protein AWJ20_3792 [Sugiyamaella lignohabitans]|uniref:Peroxin 26 n=1 Tax=Sugiyamaella lignohabitans TaxID=796027 RepID=A0A161HIK8_9ASCO|nr:uncharacterized protein AWJ20_3792 [Sugiyamaella lignohabitans]ANB10998.1 hypothetical protein AWJ20_3792 [Sugiyamaella lignohabitans]